MIVGQLAGVRDIALGVHIGVVVGAWRWGASWRVLRARRVLEMAIMAFFLENNNTTTRVPREVRAGCAHKVRRIDENTGAGG